MGELKDAVWTESLRTLDGRDVTLNDWYGLVMLIVNTASECGFTLQFEGLETLYQTYREKGLVVLGFPCNQFGHQEPGDDEAIGQFCQKNYGVSFPMMSKVEVNGKNAHPIFAWLKAARPGLLGSQAIKWNFTKFLVDRQGQVVERFAPKIDPAECREAIERLL